MNAKKRSKKEIICRCNNVERATIENAIRNGCVTLNQIFDTTTAGVGPCGGSCRRKLQPMLDAYLQTGTFPEKIIELPPTQGTKESSTQADPNNEDDTK